MRTLIRGVLTSAAMLAGVLVHSSLPAKATSQDCVDTKPGVVLRSNADTGQTVVTFRSKDMFGTTAYVTVNGAVTSVYVSHDPQVEPTYLTAPGVTIDSRVDFEEAPGTPDSVSCHSEPSAVPSAVVGLTATHYGGGSVWVDWSAAASGAPATTYEVVLLQEGVFFNSGLTNYDETQGTYYVMQADIGWSYEVQVTPINSSGRGPTTSVQLDVMP